MKESILVTGAAGFIGMHVSKLLLEQGYQVTGIDNMNDYYDPGLKEARLQQLEGYSGFAFHVLSMEQEYDMIQLFRKNHFDYVVHLAAQAGVRYSLEEPRAYVQSNVSGFLNMLEACRHYPVKHLVYASSSSVYGANERMPFSVHDGADHPLSLYAATKLANEAMAHSYSHLYGISTTGLRFFTVYGPWGRPDMAAFKFVRSILEGKPIEVYNEGRMKRDFTYIDDIADGVVRVLFQPAEGNPAWNGLQPDPATSRAPYRLYNIGNHEPVSLLRFIEYIEQALGITAEKKYMPLQDGDVIETYADMEDLRRDAGFTASTPVEEGVRRFVDWYKTFYDVK
ncbi:NAD-dependent epimerase [Paenibacillus gansuensis]|uniref:NAD-dependent epimerase n=1 Tax=Paenibacillus gansuensis TaxID=306542 RepID=A0ABW5PJX6_9BACL